MATEPNSTAPEQLPVSEEQPRHETMAETQKEASLEEQASEPFETKGFEVTTGSSSSLSSGSRDEETLKKEPAPLPEKRGNRVTRYIFREFLQIMTCLITRTYTHVPDNFLSAYRKLFAVIFTANMAVLLALCVQNKGVPALTAVGSASSANLMTAILFRQENFVNLVYEIFTCKVLLHLPLGIRRKLAKVFHYGGCHSGCGVAAVFWYLLYTALATKDYVDSQSKDSLANMITSWVLISMFCFILTGAHPNFRRRYHDYFEAAHRFAGWVALMTFWVHSTFAARMVSSQTGDSVGMTFVKSPNFWFIITSTSCSVISWSRLRLRKVFPEVLSNHATRLHFRYKYMKPFYGIKLSNRPLLEWHAFATIPDDDGKGFSVVVSNAGDWTKHHILNPPEKLWIRGYPLHGLLYTSRLFKRIVVVATGSGIGPCLSLLFADVTPRRILWSTPNPEVTYGEGVMKAVLKGDPNAIVWNTKTQGRPDMVKLTHQLVDEYDAEAVFIISNPKLTRKVVYGMETRGIAAYGAIFDS